MNKPTLLRLASAVAFLFLFWVTLSGYFTPFLLSAGLASAVAVALFAARMDVIDAEGHPVQLGWRIVGYWGWLSKEIVKSAWDVSQIIVDPRLPISPTLVSFRPGQKTSVGLVIHANSITLTPGTITIADQRRRVPGARADARGRRRSHHRRDGPAGQRVRGPLMFAAASLALLVTLALALVRAALGPTVFDRAQAANTIGTCAMLLLAVIGFLTGRPEFLDLAIVYGLLNVIGTIAVLKFFRHGDLGDPGGDSEDGR